MSNDVLICMEKSLGNFTSRLENKFLARLLQLVSGISLVLGIKEMSMETQ